MKDIASAAGVSAMTVSLGLRNHPKLPESTRKRIRRLAAKMGYRPDPALSALVAYRQRHAAASAGETLAWVTNWPTPDGWRNPTYESYFQGVCERAEQLGYRVEHFWLRERGMNRARFERILGARNIRGLILAPHPKAHSRLNLTWERYSAVKIGYTTSHPPLHLVTASDYRSMITALDRLRRHGYRRIGCLLDASVDARVEHIWLGAFLSDQHVHNTGAAVPPLLIRGTQKRRFQAWLKANRIEAVVTTYGSFLNMEKWCEELGIRIPRDIGAAIMSNVQIDGRVSGIHGHPKHIGENAVDVLTGMLYLNQRGIPKIPRRIMIDGIWVEGKTVRSVRAVTPRA